MNEKINLGIVISIFGGVLFLLTAYLLIDLHIIKFGTGSEEENNSVIIDDNPIGPSVITNETVDPVLSDGNETEVVVPTPTPIPTPTPEPKPEPKPETKPEEPEEQVDTKGTILFNEKKYECYAGDTIDTVISASYVQTINKQSNVQSYSSSNTKIATIAKSPDINVRCIGCVAVQIKCVSEGKTKLKATSDTGATTSVDINVKKIPAGNIRFSSTKYECVVGQKVYTEMSVSDADTAHPDNIKSYKSDDNSIVSIEPATDVHTNCIKCVGLYLKCLKPGSTNITGTSVNGATVSVSTTVNNDLGKVTFDKSGYTCTEGESVNVTINASASNKNEAGSPNVLEPSHYIKTISTGDNSIASVGTKYGTNSVSATINCNKTGNTEITAISNTGVTVKAPITVKAAPSSITFTPSSISCSAGKTVSVQITYKPITSYEATIENTSIAKMNKSSIQFNCNDCISLDIKCIKAGSTKLKFRLINGYEKSLYITVR